MTKQEVYSLLKFKRFADGISTLTENGFRVTKIGNGWATLTKDNSEYYLDYHLGFKGRPYWNVRSDNWL